MEDQIIAVGGDHEESSIMNMEENVDIIVARAEKQVEALRKVLKIAVSRTNSSDWLNQQGKPYLGASGCEKIMPVFGVCFKDLKFEKKVIVMTVVSIISTFTHRQHIGVVVVSLL